MRIYALWTPKVRNNNAHICATDPRDILLSSQSWLSDATINAAQEPIVEGLQNVTLGLTKRFSIERGEFVQILHTGQSHWQVISTIGTQHPEVNIHDSVYCSCSAHNRIWALL